MQLMLLLICLKLKKNITDKTLNGTKNVEIIASLKNLSNFWRTLEMSLIDSENNLDLN